jgi:hypothetical protein
MRKILIDDAIRAIQPNAQFTTVDGVITEWKGPGIMPSEEELNTKLAELKENEPFKLLREERDRRLTACDWVVTKHTEHGKMVPEDWKIYRQALRDLPSISYRPELTEFGSLKMDSVAWPTPPE